MVFTHDLDFAAILASSRFQYPSVGQIRYPNIDPHRHGEKFAALISRLSAELERGALVTIEPEKQRVRLLPLYD